MPAGGVITIATANRHASHAIAGIETVREGEFVVMNVIETGMGIEDAGSGENERLRKTQDLDIGQYLTKNSTLEQIALPIQKELHR